MKLPVFAFLAVFLFNAQLHAQQNNPLTREDATRILLNEIIVPATLNQTLTAFLVKEPLQPGDRVESFMGAPLRVIAAPVWFAWLNDDPEGFFAHDTRFVFIDVQSGKVDIVKSEWWPVLNGEALFMSEEDMKDLDLIIYSDMHRN
ncbi:MAG: hypothetical protein ACE5FF_07125 [Saprospiraceae bacterium]